MNFYGNSAKKSLSMISKISIIDMSDAPRKSDNAPPNVFKKSQIVGNFGFS